MWWMSTILIAGAETSASRRVTSDSISVVRWSAASTSVRSADRSSGIEPGRVSRWVQGSPAYTR